MPGHLPCFRQLLGSVWADHISIATSSRLSFRSRDSEPLSDLEATAPPVELVVAEQAVPAAYAC